MNEIQRAAYAAKRRLNLGVFIAGLAWSLFAGLMVALVAWSVPKIWALDGWFDLAQLPLWYAGWLIAGCLLGLCVALWNLLRRRRTALDAAIEVDSRFGLKERLSSALNLDDEDAQSAAGLALISDASDRARRIDVRDRFPVGFDRRGWLPIIPAAAIFGLWFVPDAKPKELIPAVPVVNERKQIEIAIEEAKKSLEEQAKQLEEKGLRDAATDLKTLAKKLDDLPANDADLKRDALVKLNNAREELDKKRSELGDVEAMKQNLAQLKSATEGPAQKLAEAMSDGNFEEAKKLVQELAKKIKEGKLTEQEKKNLAKDLDQLAKAAEKLLQDHEQAKRDLEEAIKQAQAQGDLQKASELQEKLEKKQAMDKQMDQIKKAAENMKKCADCMGNNQGQGQNANKQPQPNKNGDQKKSGGEPNESGDQKSDAGQGQPNDAEMKKARQALEDLAEQMEQMAGDQEMLEQLQDLEQDLQDCKDEMNGCPIPGEGNNQKRVNDFAKGDGRGHGKRDLQETETGEFKSKVKAVLQKGETVATGDADGNNVSGASAAEARELIKAEMSKQTDPLEDQQLPRSQREQAKQYFEKLRTGK